MRKFLIAGLLTAGAAPLFAQTAAPPVAPRAVAPVAAAPDRVVTRAEVDAKVRAHFAKVDTNRDGFVTADEMTAMRATRMAKRGERTGQGAMRDPNAAFDRLDTNKDGEISREEFAKGREVRIEKRVVRNQEGATPGQPGAMRMPGMGGGMIGMHMLEMADSNKDGRISLAEATTGALQHFDKIDTNRDGRITPEERRAGRGMMRQMRVQQAG